MAVTHAYSDPTSIRNVTLPTGKGVQLSPETGLFIYRVFNTQVHNLARNLIRGTETPLRQPQNFRMVSRGTLIFSTYPPIYKTSLGASSSKFPTPRQFPPIFLNTSGR